MTIAIHQPNFFPSLHYFHKMENCDLFVILDNVQFEKNLFQNRNRIKTPQGIQWLTAPVNYKFHQKINEVLLANYPQTQKKLIKTIELNYKKSKNFDKFFPWIRAVLMMNYERLFDLNMAIIETLKAILGIKTPMVIASDYNFEGEKTDLLVNICRHFKTDTYLSGSGGSKDYLDITKFGNILVKFDNFVHPIYKQPWGEFIPNLSAIDYLFNEL